MMTLPFLSLGKLIVSSHQKSQRIAISSSVLAEVKSPNQNYKPDSVLQNFQLNKDENVLQFSYIHLFQAAEQSSNSNGTTKDSADAKKVKAPFRRLVCLTQDENGDVKKVVLNNKKSEADDTKDLSNTSSPTISLFEEKTNSNIAAVKRNCLYSDSGGGHILVTTGAIYLLRLTESPVDYFLGCAMQGQTKLCDILARSFCLEKTALLELAGDMRLYQGDVASAVSLYRQAGTKHVKTALKLAASGHTTELLTFLQAVFTSQNTEVSSGDRIHLSNLSLMAQFQQLCGSSVSRYYLEEKILQFLKTNKWYDLGLAVVQCLECGLLRLLSVLSRYLGVEGELGSVLGRQDLASLSSSLPGDSRPDLINLTLLPHLLASTVDQPGPALSLLTFLTSQLASLTSSQLSSVLHNTCPARPDLQILLAGDSGPVRQAVVELFLLAALHLLRKKQEGGERVDRSLVRRISPPGVPGPSGGGETSSSMRRTSLACGHSHALYRTASSLLSWGGGGEGRLGRGRLTVPTGGPGEVPVLRKVSVISVHCGKQHSLAVTDCGLYTWGCNKYGQLGLGLGPGLLVSSTTPRHLDLEVVQVSAGQYHSVGLDRQGRVHCWGWNVHGQVGCGGIEDVFSPRQVPGLAGHTVVQVAAGYAHTVVLTGSGLVLAWGCGLFGQLGGGNTSKQARPVLVPLPGPVTLLTAGYFHSLALTQSGQVMVWGANPQILRLEAQQRKKEKLLQKQLEEARRQEMPEGELTGESCLESLHPQDAGSSSETHLVPSQLDLTSLAGEKISGLTAGSQHSLILTQRGKLYSWGRNLEGQLGLGNRTSLKVPTVVSALAEETVVEVAAGADFTLAVTQAGTVFGWGSNAGGQLGRPPLEPGADQQDNSRLVVMKTTKRIIRLQHGLQNSCDQPRPVQGIPRTGVYSDTLSQPGQVSPAQFYRDNQLARKFPGLEPVFSTKLLQRMTHITMEEFKSVVDQDKIIRQCLLTNNLQAAAKLSFLAGKHNQAFDMTIQVITATDSTLALSYLNVCVSQALMRCSSGVEESLLEALVYYCSCPEISRDEKCQIFLRLVSCWQDNNFSHAKLETFLLNFQDQNLVNIIILALFCPQEDSDTDQG